MTDQITKEPEIVEKVKNPKRVAAGKKLAEYRKKAKLATTKTEKEEALTVEPSKSWMPLMIVLSIVGISLTATDIYLRLKKDDSLVSIPREKKKDVEPRKTGME
jgi:uncharacterized membrane protein